MGRCSRDLSLRLRSDICELRSTDIAINIFQIIHHSIVSKFCRFGGIITLEFNTKVWAGSWIRVGVLIFNVGVRVV